MIATAAALVVAIAVWHTCWTLGELREDQELKESGPVFGALAAGVAVFAVNLAFPPTVLGTVPPIEHLVEWSLLQATQTSMLALFGLVAFEYEVWRDRREHDGLLLGAVTDGGEQT